MCVKMLTRQMRPQISPRESKRVGSKEAIRTQVAESWWSLGQLKS